MDGWMDGQTDGHTDGRTDSPCVLQDFVPFRAAAQKNILVEASKNCKDDISLRSVLVNVRTNNIQTQGLTTIMMSTQGLITSRPSSEQGSSKLMQEPTT